MRLLLLTLLLACLMVELVRGQKGGAKGAMRNRGRGGGGAGRRGGGGAAGEEEDDEFSKFIVFKEMLQDLLSIKTYASDYPHLIKRHLKSNIQFHLTNLNFS